LEQHEANVRQKKEIYPFLAREMGVEGEKCTFRAKKWPKSLVVEKKALPLHSQTGNNGIPQATL